VQEGLFLVIAAKKKDYLWRIFFSFPFAEERKRQNPKTKKYRLHVLVGRFKAKIHNKSYNQVLSVAWYALHHALFSKLKLKKN